MYYKEPENDLLKTYLDRFNHSATPSHEISYLNDSKLNILESNLENFLMRVEKGRIEYQKSYKMHQKILGGNRRKQRKNPNPSSNDLRLKRLEKKLDKLVSTLSKKIHLEESTEREERKQKNEKDKVPRINIEKIPISENHLMKFQNEKERESQKISEEYVYVDHLKPELGNPNSQRTRNRLGDDDFQKVVKLLQELEKVKNENFLIKEESQNLFLKIESLEMKNKKLKKRNYQLKNDVFHLKNFANPTKRTKSRGFFERGDSSNLPLAPSNKNLSSMSEINTNMILSKDLQDTRQQLVRLEKENKDLRNKWKISIEKYEEAVSETKKMRKLNHSLKDKYSNLEKRYDIIRADFETSQNKLNDLTFIDLEGQKYEEKIGKFEEKVQELEKEKSLIAELNRKLEKKILKISDNKNEPKPKFSKKNQTSMMDKSIQKLERVHTYETKMMSIQTDMAYQYPFKPNEEVTLISQEQKRVMDESMMLKEKELDDLKEKLREKEMDENLNKSQVKESNKLVEYLEDEKEKIEKKQEELETKIEELEEEVEHWKNESQNFQKTTEELKTEIEVLNDEKEKEIQEYYGKIQELQDKIIQVENENLEKIKLEKEKWKEESEEYEQKIKFLEQEKERLELKIKSIEKNLEAAKSQPLDNSNSGLIHMIEEQKGKIKKLELELKQEIRHRTQAADMHLEELNKIKEKLKQKKEKEAKMKLLENLDDNELTVKQLVEKNLGEEYHNINKKYKQLKADHSSMKTEMRKKISELRKEYENYKENHKLFEVIAEEKKDVKKMERMKRGLIAKNESIAELRRNVKDLEERIDELEDENGVVFRTQQEERIKLKGLGFLFNDFEVENQNEKSEMEKMKQAVEYLVAKNQILKENFEELKKKVKKLEEEAGKGGMSKDVKSKIASLEKEVNEAREEAQIFQMKWSEQMIQLSEMTDLNNKYVNALRRNGIRLK